MMKCVLLVALIGLGVCSAAVDRRREDSSEEDEFVRREILHEIDDLERDVRSHASRKTLLSYNIGMLPAVAKFAERRSALPDFFDNLDADFVCLQEAWFMKDVKTLLEHTKDRFPYTYSLQHTSLSTLNANANEAPCNNATQFNTALICTLTNCYSKGHTGMALLGCAAQYCGLLSLRQECISCVAYSGGDMNHIQGCATPDYALDYLGLLVLSKHEPTSYELKFYEPAVPQFLVRGYIQFEFPDLKRVLCTHLTADLGPYFEALAYKSFQEQQAAEIGKLVAMVQSDKDLTIMGDLNTGPPVPQKNIQKEAGDNYQLFKKNGFKSPFEQKVNECTWCSNNPLISGTNNSHEIDFILLHGQMRASTVKRVYDENIPGMSHPLSDHYGVKMEVWRKPLSWWQKISKWACRWFLPWCKKRSLRDEDMDSYFEEEENISQLI